MVSAPLFVEDRSGVTVHFIHCMKALLESVKDNGVKQPTLIRPRKELDRILHHCQVVSIKGESYRLKERKELMKQKQHVVNTLFAEPKVI